MTELSVFEKATREALDFQIPNRGLASIHDLWGLKLDMLDKLAIGLNNKVKSYSTAEDSFLPSKHKKESYDERIDKLKLAVIKRIIEVRVEEQEHKEKAVAVTTHNRRIDELIRRKKEQELEDMSIEDLEKMRK